MLLIIPVFLVWLLTVILCIGEAWAERDWPRDTIRGFVISSVVFVSLLVILG